MTIFKNYCLLLLCTCEHGHARACCGLCVEISRFPPLCGVPSLGAIPHPILVVYESLKSSSLVSSGWFSPSFIFTLRCLFCFVECLSGNQRDIKCVSLPEAGRACWAARLGTGHPHL